MHVQGAQRWIIVFVNCHYIDRSAIPVEYFAKMAMEDAGKGLEEERLVRSARQFLRKER